MSYIGNPVITTDFPADTLSGNGTTTAFTLSRAPASANAVVVIVSGVVQDPSTYSVSGTTLTFSAAPPSGTNNISVRHLGVVGIINTPATGSVVADTIADGVITSAKFASGQTPSFNGIAFPATQSPSANANTLDDYEEGTWTPTLTGFSGSPTVTANYVKIGQVVYCSVTLGTSGTYITCTNGYLSQPFSGGAYGTGSYYCNDGTQRGVIQAVPYGNPAILSPGNITGTSVYLINLGWFIFVG